NKSYASFPKKVPIPLDVHVARMALYSGIVEDGLPENLKDNIQRIKDIFLMAWSYVAEKVSEILNKDISPLRIDSLIWQLSKEAQKVNYERRHAAKYIVRYLVGKAGISESAAIKVAQELTYNMPDYTA
ncbi:MAG: hypothetical protein DRJ33_07360, partial [Candidatus Methanomethylicota archaeon]